MSNQELTDLQLVEMVKGGDRKAFSVLVRRHQKGLLRMSYRFLKDEGSAEDVVQESLIKAFERLNSFEARASFKSWLYQITINTAKNKLRDRFESMSDIEDVPLAVNAVAESDLVQSAIASQIQTHIDKLPFKQKTALTLRVYEDLSFKEISEIMDCPYDTAKANYRHALMRLREEFEQEADLKNWSAEINHLFHDLGPMAVEVEQ